MSYSKLKAAVFHSSQSFQASISLFILALQERVSAASLFMPAFSITLVVVVLESFIILVATSIPF